MAQVLDYVASPGAAAIASAGFVGAARYLAPLPNSKCLTDAEVADFAAHGLALTLVWESYANRAREGANVGHADGAMAAQQAKARGAAPGTCIFGAVDFPAPQSDWPQIAAYLDGLRAEARAEGFRGGGYGDAPLALTMIRDGHVDLWWQSFAWSGGVILTHTPEVVLFQRQQQTTVNGHQVDVNDCLRADWGQWWPGGTPAPPSAQEADMAMTLVPSWATLKADGRCEFYQAVQGADPNTFVVYSFNGAQLDRVDGTFVGQWFQRQTNATGPVVGLAEIGGEVVALCDGGGGGVYRIGTQQSAGHP